MRPTRKKYPQPFRPSLKQAVPEAGSFGGHKLCQGNSATASLDESLIDDHSIIFHINENV